jgi:hypothetical protein
VGGADPQAIVTTQLILPAVPAGNDLSSLIYLLDDIGHNAGNTISVQQLDNVWNLISLFKGQFAVTYPFGDADAVFFQNPDSLDQISNPKPQNGIVLHIKRGKRTV